MISKYKAAAAAESSNPVQSTGIVKSPSKGMQSRIRRGAELSKLARVAAGVSGGIPRHCRELADVHAESGNSGILIADGRDGTEAQIDVGTSEGER